MRIQNTQLTVPSELLSDLHEDLLSSRLMCISEFLMILWHNPCPGPNSRSCPLSIGSIDSHLESADNAVLVFLPDPKDVFLSDQIGCIWSFFDVSQEDGRSGLNFGAFSLSIGSADSYSQSAANCRLRFLNLSFSIISHFSPSPGKITLGGHYSGYYTNITEQCTR